MDHKDPYAWVAERMAQHEKPVPAELSKAPNELGLPTLRPMERNLLWDNSDLQNYLMAEFGDRLEDESAIQSAIRLLKESKELPVSKDWMELQSYTRFEPLGDDPQYELRDMVWGVARACRFAGQISEEHEHYSVAEHLVLLFDHVWLGMEDSEREVLREAVRREDWEVPLLRLLRTLLTHDLQEGLIGDMVRPMKRQDPIYRRIEDRLSAHMAHRWSLQFPLPQFVKDLDNRILLDERAQACGISQNNWGSIEGLEPLGVVLQFWSPRRAFQELSTRLEELGFKL